MEANTKNTAIKVIALFAWLLIAFPFIQSNFLKIKNKSLKGAIETPTPQDFNLKYWITGQYQELKEKEINSTFGFHSIFIRIYNELHFRIANKANANGVLIGKNGYLYELNYIKAYYGDDYIGDSSVDSKFEKIKFLNDTLSKLNKHLLIVFAAGKGSFYPEYFPEEWQGKKRKKTNYELFSFKAHELGIPHIDFMKWFSNNKKKSPYPLYPKYGIHWSYYSEFLVGDSILRFIEKNISKSPMPVLAIDSIEMDNPRERDYDIADGLNILTKLSAPKMAYPKFEFKYLENKKLNSIIIADSYYWGLFNIGYSQVFNRSSFWFYNKQVYPNSFEKEVLVDQLSLQNELQENDLFIIMATEATLPNLGWGFIDNAFEHYKKGTTSVENLKEFNEKVGNLMHYIKTDDNWMKVIKQDAENNNITIEEALKRNAEYVIKQEITKK